MSRKLKVFCANLDGRHEGVVAATSQKEAARLLGMSLGSFRTWGHETGNTEQIDVAMREPGVAWKRSFANYHAEWIRIEPRKNSQ